MTPLAMGGYFATIVLRKFGNLLCHDVFKESESEVDPIKRIAVDL